MDKGLEQDRHGPSNTHLGCKLDSEKREVWQLCHANESETAVNGCHCSDDVAVRMRKVAISRSGFGIFSLCC